MPMSLLWSFFLAHPVCYACDAPKYTGIWQYLVSVRKFTYACSGVSLRGAVRIIVLREQVLFIFSQVLPIVNNVYWQVLISFI